MSGNMSSNIRKRKPPSSAKRWKIFRRDGFKCIYCGSSDELVIDHGDPFSRGGDDDENNFVTACRKCNSGKRDSEIIPKYVGDVEDPESEYKSQFISDWISALTTSFSWLFPSSTKVFVDSLGKQRSVIVDCDFVSSHFSEARLMSLEGRLMSLEGRRLRAPHRQIVNVVIIPSRDYGQYDDRTQGRIRDAVSMGMTDKGPVMLLMGSPFYFYGVFIDGIYKGIPGLPWIWEISDRLMMTKKQLYSDWYPDEEDFKDPRDAFGLRAAQFPIFQILKEQHEQSKAFLGTDASCQSKP